MRILNFDLFKNIILPGLLETTVWSALIAIAVGTVIGLIIGAIKRRTRQTAIRQTILSAISGCFIATMLITMLPILATPGLLGGGPSAGILIMMIVTFTLPVSAIGGSLVGGLKGIQFLKKYHQRSTLWLLAGTYAFMTIVTYTTVSIHCSSRNTLPLYCTTAGYPSQAPKNTTNLTMPKLPLSNPSSP